MFAGALPRAPLALVCYGTARAAATTAKRTARVCVCVCVCVCVAACVKRRETAQERKAFVVDAFHLPDIVCFSSSARRRRPSAAHTILHTHTHTRTHTNTHTHTHTLLAPCDIHSFLCCMMTRLRLVIFRNPLRLSLLASPPRRCCFANERTRRTFCRSRATVGSSMTQAVMEERRKRTA